MNYKFTKIKENIILVDADSQFGISSMFIRLQEFYESPFENIRGKFFTLEEFMDTYTKSMGGHFSYFTDWDGVNVPGSVFKKFIEKFQYSFSTKENLLVNSIRNIIPNLEGDFYIIGIFQSNKSHIKHEMAHAFWFLDRSYKEKMIELVYNEIPIDLHGKAEDSLQKYGYGEDFLIDEMQAYLSTSSKKNILKIFNWKKNVKITSKFRKFYKDYTNNK